VLNPAGITGAAACNGENQMRQSGIIFDTPETTSANIGIQTSFSGAGVKQAFADEGLSQ